MRTTAPTKIQECRIKDYIRWESLVKEYNESDDPNKDIKLISDWFGQDFSEMDSATAGAFINEFIREMSDVDVIENATKQGKAKPPKSIKIAGIKFEVPQKMEHSCKISQYIDYTSYLNSYKGPDLGFHAIALAIFLKKPKELYSQINIADRIEFMQNVNVIDSSKIVAFFLIQSERFRNITLQYYNQRGLSQKQTEKEPQAN